MQISLTNKIIREAQRAGERAELWDANQPGLLAIVTPAGTATFYASYRSAGRKRRYKIGRFGDVTISDARTRAGKARSLAADGKDPAQERADERTAPTVRDACERFVREHGPKLKPRTLRGYQQQIDAYVVPKLGAIKIAALARADVAALHSKIGKEHPGAANRVLALVSSLCTHAERWGLRPINSNPAKHVAKFREQGAGHYLDAAELAALHKALGEAEAAPRGNNAVYVSPGAVDAIRLLLHTGMRVSEVIDLEWTMVDLDRNRLHLPDEISKTGAKVVPLGPGAVRILQRLYDARERSVPWVVTSETSGPVHNIQRAWRSIRKRAGLEHVRLHDLRHSFASTAIEAGAPLELVGAALGHRSVLTTQRYRHVADAALQRTVETFSDALDAKIAAGADVARLPVAEAPKRPKPRRGSKRKRSTSKA